MRNGAIRYFVGETEIPLAQLGRATAESWLAHSGGASIDQCWFGTPAIGEYTVAGRTTTICRIVIRSDEGVRYRDLASARNALRDAGFTRMALLNSDESRVVFDEHLPLDPVPIRLRGSTTTIVRITSSPDTTEPVIGIVNERGWNVTTLARLGQDLRREVARNNPALAADELNGQARICVRPDSSVLYVDVLPVLATIRDQGFWRVGLYSEAVVAID